MKISVVPLQPEYKILLDKYPPVPSNKFLPDWYRDMKRGNKIDMYLNNVDGRTTGYNAKNCPAIQDTLSSGFIIPMWSDFAYNKFDIERGDVTNQVDSYYLSTPDGVKDAKLTDFLTSHEAWQIGEMPINVLSTNILLKLTVPYRFIVPEGYSIFYSDPFYHFRNDLRCLTGDVEADKWGSITFPFHTLSDKFLLKAGTPLVHAHVYKRKTSEVELDIRDATKEEEEQWYSKWFTYQNERIQYKTLPDE